MDTTCNFKVTSPSPEITEFICTVLESHELARAVVGNANGIVKVYHEDDTRELFTLTVKGNAVHVDGPVYGTEPPTGPKDLILDEGFCHTGDAMEATMDTPVPDSLVEFNYIFAKKAERCGCCSCGAIFPGSEIKRYFRDNSGDLAGTAICPYCGGMSVIAEENGVKVNENNLWRWFGHVYGNKPMYGKHPLPAPRKISL